MIFLVPYEIETLQQERPWANWLIVAACSVVSLMALFGGVLAALVHVLMDGDPAIGASGAINGVVGIAFAMYPMNRVHLFWFILIRGGFTSCRAWLLFLAWFAFDIWGAYSGDGMIAYWGHIGGFAGGLVIGLIALHFNWFQLTEHDNRSLLEIMRGEHPG